MKMRANTMFITGGGTGIGRGLAEAFHKLGNRVIVGGRRAELLQQVCAANPGMGWVAMDVTDAAAVKTAAREILAKFPEVNCVINNAGVQRLHDFSSMEPLREDAAKDEIETNFFGLMRVSAEFFPYLAKQKDAVLINVSSGLAFVPLPRFPVYCANKAAVHSFTLSLRQQVKAIGVKVIELIPPYVATDLNNGHRPPAAANLPAPMPLDVFIVEAMAGLATDDDEVAVGRAKTLQAASNPAMKEILAGMRRD